MITLRPWVIAILIVCVACVLVEAVIQDTLDDANHRIVVKLQAGDSQGWSARYAVLHGITLLGDQGFISGILFLNFLLPQNKLHGLKIIFSTLIASYILSLLKMFYSRPRPYFVHADMHGIGCNIEFGQPSGHAMVLAVLFFHIFDSVLNNRYVISQQQAASKQSDEEEAINIDNAVPSHVLPVKTNEVPALQNTSQDKFLGNFLAVFTYVIIILSIGFSRVFLGVHSFSQVILGWCYASAYLLGYKYFLSSQMENLLNEAALKSNRFQSRSLRVKVLVILTLVYILVIATAVITYSVANHAIDSTLKNIYRANITADPTCAKGFKEIKFLAGGCFSDTSVITLVYSMLLFTSIMDLGYNPNELVKQSPTIGRKAIQFIVIVAVCLIGQIIFELLKSDNNYIQYFFNDILRFFVLSATLIIASPWVLKLTNTQINHDYISLKKLIQSSDQTLSAIGQKLTQPHQHVPIACDQKV